jgi:hypothetical protein
MSCHCFSAAVTAGRLSGGRQRNTDDRTAITPADAAPPRCRGMAYLDFTPIFPIIKRNGRVSAGCPPATTAVNSMRQSVKTIAILVAANLLTLGLFESAGAGVISTEAAIEIDERTARIERINSVLARDSVQSQMVRLGVQPDVAAARIASLSDSELAELEARMDELPAGADSALTVLGIVLLVLLVLELVGVTDIFKSF